MFVVFIGPPGAGKGTQCQKLVDHLHIPHLSTGELLRQAYVRGEEIGVEAHAYMAAGQLVPDPLIVQLVEQKVDSPECAGGCLFDGFPRTLVQAKALEQHLLKRKTPLDIVLELRVEESVLVDRLAGRGRSDDQPEIVRHRLKGFYERIQTLLDYYNAKGLLHTIDGLGSPEQVFERIKAALSSKQPG